MERRFLHPKFEVSTFRLIGGIVIGLCYAFFFYSFLYLCRETLRVLSFTEEYDLWILSDDEVQFYNLFFAFIAVILAQSKCFVFWFDKPKRVFQKQSFRRRNIVNDQRILNWVFLSWYSKLAFLFGILFGATFYGGFYEFSLLPDYKYLFILLVIVLFFQSWKEIRLYYKNRSFKWMCFSILIITGLSYSLSNIQLTNYKSINKHFLQNNIHTDYLLEYVASESYNRLDKKTWTETISLVIPRDSNPNSEPVIVIYGGKVSFDELPYPFNNWLGHYDIYDPPTVCLKIHKDIPMNYVNRLKQALIKDGIYRIAYAYIHKQNVKSNILRSYDHKIRYFPTKLQQYNLFPFEYKQLYENTERYSNQIVVKQNDQGGTFINEEYVQSNELKELFKRRIREDQDYLITWHLNENVTFEQYFEVFSSHRDAIHELRNEEAMLLYQKRFFLLSYEEQRIVKKKFPVRSFEITLQLLEEINLTVE